MKFVGFDEQMAILSFWVDTNFGWPDESQGMTEQLYAEYKRWA